MRRWYGASQVEGAVVVVAKAVVLQLLLKEGLGEYFKTLAHFQKFLKFKFECFINE